MTIRAMQDYAIVQSESASDLRDKVRLVMLGGWEPVGGVSHAMAVVPDAMREAHGRGGYGGSLPYIKETFSQAIVRYA